MIASLKCPECSAPLQYPAQGAASMRCPYCNATVLISSNAPAAERSHGPVHSHFAPTLHYSARTPAIDRSYTLKVGVGATLGVLVLIAVILGFFAVSGSQKASPVSSISTPSMVASAPPQIAKPIIPPPPPAPPAFAHMVLDFGTEGIGAGAFTDARSIAVDNQGHVYVGEYLGGRIQVFDPQGKFISTWSIGTDAALLNLAADRHGIVYAVTPSHLYRFDGPTGKPLGEFELIRQGITESISDVFPALDGDLYAITGSRHIAVISPDGQIKKTFDAQEKVGESLTLQRILVIGAGEIFAMDSSKGIFKFAPDGHYINRFNGGPAAKARNELPGHSFSPRNFAADGKGRLYISESGASILVFDPDGNFLDAFGGTEIVFGLAITDQNEIYGCFRNRCSIRKFVLDKK